MQVWQKYALPTLPRSTFNEAMKPCFAPHPAQIEAMFKSLLDASVVQQTFDH